MDYRKAWDEVKSKLEESIQEGRDNGYDEGSETYASGMYDAYKRVLDHVISLESQIPEDIKVRDTVRVVNPDLCYPSYGDWIKQNVENPFLAVRWAANRVLRKGETGIVRYLAPHSPEDKTVIAYIDVGNACFMIRIDGLEKIVEG